MNFSLINSSAVQKPKMVHKILPYLTYKHQRTDKVALLVMDGMTYWQYLILDQCLNNRRLVTKKDITFAWLPTITQLSRQAIFRGEAPKMDYRQSPAEENRLWKAYWQSRPAQKRMQDYEVGYMHNNRTIEHSNLYRYVMVDTKPDEIMHTLASHKDLYALTANWAEEVANDIKTIHEQGYQIYITTDHGNVYAYPWRALSSQEKTCLYEKESRGNRHLIYNNADCLHDFLHANQQMVDEWLVRDERWVVWRSTKSFSNNEGITHGGSHFLEVIIPFITINRK